MSNIVGYIGQRNALPIVIEALKRLEYLGCDSAGCAIIHNNKLQIYKKQGKIVDLERSLPEPNQCSGNVAIAHTRWATHGEPSEVNAHPQIDCHGKIAIVHNGIIENYNPLKKQLIELGHTFRSETDTEVIAHLIEQYRKSEPTLEDAIRAALSKVEGTYGLVIL